jgi:hypothetical protein
MKGRIVVTVLRPTRPHTVIGSTIKARTLSSIPSWVSTSSAATPTISTLTAAFYVFTLGRGK